jgi:hypothetical protein
MVCGILSTTKWAFAIKHIVCEDVPLHYNVMNDLEPIEGPCIQYIHCPSYQLVCNVMQ